MFQLNGCLLIDIKMKTKIFTALVLLVLVMGTVQASIVASIGAEGLSFLKPGLGDIIKGVLCVSGPLGALTCVEQYIGGKIIGYVSGEIMQTISEVSPEAYNAIVTYNKIKGYVDKGASLLEELKINEEGEIKEGRIDFGEEEYSIKEFFTNLSAEDVVISNAEYDFETKKLEIKEDGFLKIKIKDEEGEVQELVYENIQEGGMIGLSETGEILRVDFTVNEEGGEYVFGDNTISVPPFSRVLFEKDVGIQVRIPEGTDITKYSDLLTYVEGGYFTEIDGKNIRLSDDFILLDGLLSVNPEGYLLKQGEVIYKQNKFKVKNDNEEILMANLGEDLSDYDGNWIRQTSDVLEMQTNGEGRIKIEVLEDHEILNTDSKDILSMNILNGDGLRIENREDEGLIPKVIHKSSENGRTSIDNDKIDIVLEDGLSFEPPGPLYFEFEWIASGEFQSVAMEIESDSSEMNTKMRVNSYRQFAILSEDDEELVTYNKYDLPVSAKIEDNELQTIEQLREKYPGVEFEIPQYTYEYGSFGFMFDENLINENNIPPYMLYLTDTFLESNPDAVEGIEKMVFLDTDDAYLNSLDGTIVIGQKVVDFPEFAKFDIRSQTSPLQLLKHEYEHRLDQVIANEEYERIKSEVSGLLPIILFQREETLTKQISDLTEERNIYDINSQEWFGLDYKINGKKEDIYLLRAGISSVYYKLSSQNTLQYKYNELASDAIKELARSESFSNSFNRVSSSISDYTEKKLNQILEESYDTDFSNSLAEMGEEESGEDRVSQQLQVINYFLDKEDSFESPSFSKLIQLNNLLFSVKGVNSNLASGKKNALADSLDMFYTDIISDPNLRRNADNFERLIRRTSGLPYGYGLHNSNYLSEDFDFAAYKEISSTYREMPIEERRFAVQSGNNIIRETFTRLTQLAFDSGKMDVEEFVTIMGEGFCKEADCFDKLCVEYKLLCCEEHPSSVNCADPTEYPIIITRPK